MEGAREEAREGGGCGIEGEKGCRVQERRRGRVEGTGEEAREGGG